jgi:hypothetical protein
MQRPVKLVVLAEFPASERASLQGVLSAAHIPAQHVCVSRLEPLEQGLPAVTVVSLPGWCCSYAGPDWLAALAGDLAEGAATVRARRITAQ